ncbi:MAG: M48 family metallopeptidase [Bacteroidales bacterium]|nr:M48 family metallopeptidase [Bacteroidales bacterium]
MKRLNFAALVAAVISSLILVSCGSVPLTGRKQILLVSDQEVFEAGLTQYKAYMSEAQVSTDAGRTALVKKVGSRLSDATERYLRANGFESEISNLKWEFNLVKNPEVNAFCLPGGKIVVYEGLFAIAQTEAELAVVLGHEIGHAVAKHSNERMSQQILAQYGMAILSSALSEKSTAVQSVATSVFGLGAQVGLMLPYSRKHEYEADYMGLVFMEIAGYDSESALTFWKKMSSGSSSSSDFLSTHPSDSKRIAAIDSRISEARGVAQTLK